MSNLCLNYCKTITNNGFILSQKMGQKSQNVKKMEQKWDFLILFSQKNAQIWQKMIQNLNKTKTKRR